jgi:hypothetical protein
VGEDLNAGADLNPTQNVFAAFAYPTADSEDNEVHLVRHTTTDQSQSLSRAKESESSVGSNYAPLSTSNDSALGGKVDENAIVSIKLIHGGREKGLKIQSRVTIDTGDAYEKVELESDGTIDAKHYFTTHRSKYYAIGIMNAFDKKLRRKKGAVKIVYQVLS